LRTEWKPAHVRGGPGGVSALGWGGGGHRINPPRRETPGVAGAGWLPPALWPPIAFHLPRAKIRRAIPGLPNVYKRFSSKVTYTAVCACGTGHSTD
jgi:hypothetical protein